MLPAWLAPQNRELAVLRLDGVELRDLKFPNGEAYRGGWKDARVRPGGGQAPAAAAAEPPPPPPP